MSFQADAPFTTAPEYRPQRTDADGISVGQILGTLRRRYVVLLATVFGITALGLVVIKLLTPTFTSTAIIIIAAREDSVVDMQPAYMQSERDGVTRSEIDALQSRTVIERVVDRDNLMDDPEFNIYAQPYKPNLVTRLGLVDKLPRFVQPYLRSKPLDPTLFTPEQLKYKVVSKLLRAVDVASDAKTYTVKVNLTSVDSAKAARLANDIVDEYLKTQVDNRIAAADRAGGWIEKHLTELKAHVEDTDHAVEEFREKHNIVDYPGTSQEGNTLALQQVQNLAQQLAAARVQRSQLEASQKEVEQLIDNPDHVLSAPAVSSVPIVENLRVQEVTAAARLAELQGTYAAGHPQVIDATQALAKIREHLRDESLRAAKQLDIQTREAQSNEAQLQQRLDELTSVRHDENRLLPKLRQLEAEQASARTVYDTFEKGWYRALVQDGVPSPKGRVIQAATPTDWPAFPNVPILLAAIFVASVMVGVAVVFVFEARDKSFHTAEEIEDEVGLPVLGMSLLAPAGLRRFIGRRTPVSQQMLAKPNSALSESVRFVRSAITFAHSDQQPKVVMVTSAVPGEGKTTFALMLARLSAQSGKRVLAIEAETRRPSFGRDLSPLPKKGLTEYLTGRATFEEVLGMDRESGLHFIATRERGKFGNDLLSSAQMAALLERARQDYDFVVVDTPPSTVVADAFELGRLADSVVLVVKWACTPRHIVAQAARKLRAANIPLVGTVLTQVDTARYAAYGHGQLPYQYAKAYYITH